VPFVSAHFHSPSDVISFVISDVEGVESRSVLGIALERLIFPVFLSVMFYLCSSYVTVLLDV